MAFGMPTRTRVIGRREMTEWIYFLHPPRDHFAATMTDEERAVWAQQFDHLKRRLAEGGALRAGPTLESVNMGIVVFEASDEVAARQVMESDPVVEGRFARAELRQFRLRCCADATDRR